MGNKLPLRPATAADLPAVMAVYAAARTFMAEHGNPHQWGDDGYPARELVAQDIAQGKSYVALGPDDQVHGVFFYAPGPDPTYAVIEDGAWSGNGPYGVIHRIASDGTARGLLAAAVAFALEQCGQIRIDTHHHNHVMQAALAKAGFTRRGIIHLENGDPRIAYEKTTQEG